MLLWFSQTDSFSHYLEIGQLVTSKALQVQILAQSSQLSLSQWFLQKPGNLDHSFTHILSQVFVEQEKHIGMMAFKPGVQNVRKERRIINFVVHEVLGKEISVSKETVSVEQFVVAIIRHDDILWIPYDIHYFGGFK